MEQPVAINDPVLGLDVEGKAASLVADGMLQPLIPERGQGQPLNIQENWSITDRAARPILTDTLAWTSGMSINQKIYETTAGQQLRKMTNLLKMISQYNYCRFTSLEGEILMNTNQYQSGCLALYILYEPENTVNRWQSATHTIFTVSEGNSLKFTIPWASKFDWMKVTDDTVPYFGLRVVTPLTAANEVTPELDIKIFVHFTGFEVMYTVPAFDVQSKDENIVYYPTTSKLFRPDGTATVMGNIASTISDEASLEGEATIAQFLSHPYIFNEWSLQVSGARTPYKLQWWKIMSIQAATQNWISNYGFISNFSAFTQGSVKIKLTGIRNAFTHFKLAIFAVDEGITPATDSYKDYPYLTWDLKESHSFEFIAPVSYSKYRMIPSLRFEVASTGGVVARNGPTTAIWIQAINNVTSTDSSQTTFPFVGQVTPQWTPPGTPGGLQFFMIRAPNWVPMTPAVRTQSGVTPTVPILGCLSQPIIGNYSDMEEIMMIGELTQRAAAIRLSNTSETFASGVEMGPTSVVSETLPGPFPMGYLFALCYHGQKASTTLLFKTDQDVDSVSLTPGRDFGADQPECYKNLFMGAINPMINITASGYVSLEIPGTCPARFWTPRLSDELRGKDSIYRVCVLSHEFGKINQKEKIITLQGYHQTNMDLRLYFWNGIDPLIPTIMNDILYQMDSTVALSIPRKITQPDFSKYESPYNHLEKDKKRMLKRIEALTIERNQTFDEMVEILENRPETSSSQLQMYDQEGDPLNFFPRASTSNAPAREVASSPDDELIDETKGARVKPKKKNIPPKKLGIYAAATEAMNNASQILEKMDNAAARVEGNVIPNIERATNAVAEMLEDPFGFIKAKLGDSGFGNKLSLLLLEVLDLFTSKLTKMKIAISAAKISTILGWGVEQLYDMIKQLASHIYPKQENQDSSERAHFSGAPRLEAREERRNNVANAVTVATTLATSAMTGQVPSKERTQSMWKYASETGRDLQNMKLGMSVLMGLPEALITYLDKFLWTFFGIDLKGSRDFEKMMIEVIDELIYLKKPNIWRQIPSSRSLQARAIELLEKFDLLQSGINCIDDKDLIMKYNRIPRMIQDLAVLLRENAVNSPTKFTPFHVRVIGEPQIGKSVLVDLMTKILAKSQELGEEVFHVSETNFYDGYANQDGMVRDDRDMAEHRDTSGELINFVSPVPVILNMADLTKKGRTFTTKYIISTGNNEYPTIRELSQSGQNAWLKRSHVLVKASKGTREFQSDMSHLHFVQLPSTQGGFEQQIKQWNSLTYFLKDMVQEFSQHSKTQFTITNLHHEEWTPVDWSTVDDEQLTEWVERKMKEYFEARKSRAFKQPTLQMLEDDTYSNPQGVETAPNELSNFNTVRTNVPIRELSEDSQLALGLRPPNGPMELNPDFNTDDESDDETYNADENIGRITEPQHLFEIAKIPKDGQGVMDNIAHPFPGQVQRQERDKYYIVMKRFKHQGTSQLIMESSNRYEIRENFSVIVKGKLSLREIDEIRRNTTERSGTEFWFAMQMDEMTRLNDFLAKVYTTVYPSVEASYARRKVKTLWRRISKGLYHYMNIVLAAFCPIPVDLWAPRDVAAEVEAIRAGYVNRMLLHQDEYLAQLRRQATNTPLIIQHIRNMVMVPPFVTEALVAYMTYGNPWSLQIIKAQFRSFWENSVKPAILHIVKNWKMVLGFLGVYLFIRWMFSGKAKEGHKVGKFVHDKPLDEIVTESGDKIIVIQDQYHNNLPTEGAHAHIHICQKCGGVYEHTHKKTVHEYLRCRKCSKVLLNKVRSAGSRAPVVVDIDPEDVELIETILTEDHNYDASVPRGKKPIKVRVEDNNYDASVPRGRKPIKVRVEHGVKYKEAILDPHNLIFAEPEDEFDGEILPKIEMPSGIPPRHTTDGNVESLDSRSQSSKWRRADLHSCPIVQGDTDNASHYLRIKLFKNMGLITYVNGNIRRTVNYVGLAGNWIMTVYHPFAVAWETKKKTFKIEITHGHDQVRRSLEVKTANCVRSPEFMSAHFKRTLRKDVLFINLKGNGLNMFQDITEKFASRDEYPRVALDQAAHLCTVDPEFPSHCTNTYIGRIELMGNVTPLSSQVGTNWGFSYEAPTRDGWCGSPLVVHNPKFPRKILGIHFAGHQGNVGYAIPVLLEDINNLKVTKQWRMNPVISDMSDREVKLQCLSEHVHFPIPVGGKNEYVGVLKPELVPYSVRKTDLRTSPIYQLVSNTTTEPAVLSHLDARNPGRNDPLYLELEKASRERPIPDRHLRKKARKQVLFQFAKLVKKDNWSNGTYRILTFDEAVNGDGAEVEPLNMKTSAGWPYVLDSKGGKMACFNKVGEFEDGRNQYEPTPEFKLHYAEALAKLRSGRVTKNWFMDSLKDERRKHEKIGATKTRIFNISNAVWLIISKQYLWWFYAFLIKWKERAGTSLGMDPFGPDVSAMVNHLLATGNIFMDTDVACWDGSFGIYLFEDVAWIVSRLSWHAIREFRATWIRVMTPSGEDIRFGCYNYKERKTRFLLPHNFEVYGEFLMINNIIMAVTCRVHIADDVVYRPKIGMPSGTYITACGNCTGHLVLDGVVFFDIYGKGVCRGSVSPEIQKDVEAGHMTSFMNNTVMGDDKLNSLSETALTFIKPKDIEWGWKEMLGYDVTNGDKTGPPDFRDLSEVTYLKCKIVEAKEYGRYRMQIDKDLVIGELTNWIRCNQPEDEAIDQNLDDALRFAYQHGEEFFNDFKSRVNHALTLRRLPIKTQTYEYYEQQWQSAYGSAHLKIVEEATFAFESIHIDQHSFSTRPSDWISRKYL